MLGVLSVLLSSSSVAWAGDINAYRACCANGGVACPEVIEAVGPGSQLGASSVRGLWQLTCNGSSFVGGRTITSAGEYGQVVTALDAVASRCFSQSCGMPGPLCLLKQGEQWMVLNCDGGPDLRQSAWTSGSPTPAPAPQPAVSAAPVYVPGGAAPVVADVSRAPVYDPSRAPVYNPNAPTPAPAPSVSWGQPAPGGAPVPPPVNPAPAPPGGGPKAVQIGSRVVSAGAAAPPVLAPDGSVLDLTVPETPPDPCRPNNTMRQASNSQVDEGNEAMMKQDLPTALGKYRAAITLMNCNAFAWAALGDTLLSLQQPDKAETSLAVATRLMKTHYTAWTNLGRAREAQGRRDEAREAYSKALEVRPGHKPAEQGLARLGP